MLEKLAWSCLLFINLFQHWSSWPTIPLVSQPWQAAGAPRGPPRPSVSHTRLCSMSHDILTLLFLQSGARRLSLNRNPISQIKVCQLSVWTHLSSYHHHFYPILCFLSLFQHNNSKDIWKALVASLLNVCFVKSFVTILLWISFLIDPWPWHPDSASYIDTNTRPFSTNW